MMSYETFEKSISALKAYQEYEDSLSDLGINIWEREEISHLITSYINIIAEGLNLPSNAYNYTDLDYYIYDLKFGEDPVGLMEDDEDKDAFCTDLKALYDYFLRLKK